MGETTGMARGRGRTPLSNAMLTIYDGNCAYCSHQNADHVLVMQRKHTLAGMDELGVQLYTPMGRRHCIGVRCDACALERRTGQVICVLLPGEGDRIGAVYADQDGNPYRQR